MSKIIGKPFIDSYGARGSSYDKYHTDHKKIKSINKKFLQFEKSGDGKIMLAIPDTIGPLPTKIQITRLNAVKLAHWLLDTTAQTQNEKEK